MTEAEVRAVAERAARLHAPRAGEATLLEITGHIHRTLNLFVRNDDWRWKDIERVDVTLVDGQVQFDVRPKLKQIHSKVHVG